MSTSADRINSDPAPLHPYMEEEPILRCSSCGFAWVKGGGTTYSGSGAHSCVEHLLQEELQRIIRASEAPRPGRAGWVVEWNEWLRQFNVEEAAIRFPANVRAFCNHEYCSTWYALGVFDSAEEAYAFVKHLRDRTKSSDTPKP
jgi:hypothetical protein